MYTLLKPLLVREELLKRGMTIFTPLDFLRLYPLPAYKIKYFLEQQVKMGLLARLKQGLYTLKTDIPSEEEIANRLYQPSYLSFEYAMAKYGIIPESPYHLTSATTNSTREFMVNNQAFSYYTIKLVAYAGYYLDTKGNRKILIAEPEKALIDYLYFVSLGQRSFNDRFNVSKLDKAKLMEYAKLFKRDKLIELVEQLPW